VDPAAILPYLTGPAAAVAVLVWVVWMQRCDIRELRRALDAQATRASSAEDAARTALATINALAGRGSGAG
jgi:hypothetical protein